MTGLTRADIEEILELIDASDFDEMNLEMGDVKLSLRRRGAVSTETQVAAPSPVAAAPAPSAVQSVAPKSVGPVGVGQEVPAPMLGTYYHAPRPGADPFVRVGDTVTEDTVIGIIEVMKLMNSVTAGINGTVAEIVAPDAELVEHGQCLIRVVAG